MAVSAKIKTHRAKIRKRQQRAREKVRSENVNKKVVEAINTMPAELAPPTGDCRMWVSPPGPDDARPRVNWDIGRATADLMEAHVKTYGVTMDEVLREIGVQFFMARPALYWALKSAKITVTNN